MDKRVQSTIEFMKTNIRHACSMSDLARLVQLSPWHFTHLFKSETSKSPIQYLNEMRIEQARQMMISTSLSIKEIVYALGLSDRSHFSRKFKTSVGVTPKEFISQYRRYGSSPFPRTRSKSSH